MNAIYFGVFGHTVEFLRNRGSSSDHRLSQQDETNRPPPTYLETFLAGCVGGFAQLVVACPVDMVKIKLQMQRNRRK